MKVFASSGENPPTYEGKMKKTAEIKKFAANGIQFSGIEFVVEIFPSPIPTEISGVDINSETDLFRMSHHEGYEELYVTIKEFVVGSTQGKNHQFSRFEFVKWQLSGFSEKTLYQLINKTGCDITQILDQDVESEQDPDYWPEEWLNPYADESGNYEKGLAYIAKVRKLSPDAFYSTLIESIFDPDYGVLEHLETQIDENLEEVRQLYSEWDVPLMIVSKGNFSPYIESENHVNMMMDDFKLSSMHVRNQDEGEIDG
jgi:hypothetical protein